MSLPIKFVLFFDVIIPAYPITVAPMKKRSPQKIGSRLPVIRATRTVTIIMKYPTCRKAAILHPSPLLPN